ncbi:hypothetical protein BDY19DRAFT_935666 [Irpex rosettiformis]|uniref:Uncharacterized protein n=1 Tax=Irpex rosettiformis TaxID=378272 RepID=A0ACB8U818_9APHY|nr:hypothetical protein BDY19DRAFT_935666 [Irpex rosettiformis]
MTVIKLSAGETARRFNVHKSIENFPSQLNKQEEDAVRVVLEYMEIAYSPTNNKGAISVAHLCVPSGNTFLAPSTFPEARTAEEYADSHAKVMSALSDLHIVQFDVVVAKENFVSLRYTATGSHNGGPHNGIQPTGRRAQWTAAGNFIVDEETGKIKHWWKDWDKMQMWKQLGWVKPDNDKVEFV